MKQCPGCGKAVADYATVCKYCRYEIYGLQQAAGPAAPQLFRCPACAGSLPVGPGGTTVACPWCGNAVVLPAVGVRRTVEPALPEPLSVRVEALIADGEPAAAARLLYKEAGLRLEVARALVERIRERTHGSTAELISKARCGELE